MDNAEMAILSDIDSMSKAIDNCEDKSLYGPSNFWGELIEKHKQFINKYGFARFKRTINFEYNQWGVSSLRSKQLWHVLKLLILKGKIPYIALLSKSGNFDDVSWPGTPGKHAELSYRIFVSLLWQYATLNDKEKVLQKCQEPLIGMPLEITYKGTLISQDLAQSSLELNKIAKFVNMSKVHTIGEIGAGCGRLAYTFIKTFSDKSYCIFDIPPALAISQNYLASVIGEQNVSKYKDFRTPATFKGNSEEKIRAFLPHELQNFPDGYFDLFINISSFDEMKADQVENYFNLIEKKCKGYFYVKGYSHRTGSENSRALGIAQFPYRNTWQMLYERVDSVQPLFIERIYKLS